MYSNTYNAKCARCVQLQHKAQKPYKTDKYGSKRKPTWQGQKAREPRLQK